MYIDAIYDRKKDEIHIVERVNGKRVFRVVDPEHVFYYEHPAGSYKTIFGDTCKKFSSPDSKKFKLEMMRKHAPREPKEKPKRIFESDINPVFRSLATHYTGAETPNLQIAYFDIEVEFAPDRGFAPTTDPFNAINAISVYCGWLDSLITLALIPPGMSQARADEIADSFENTFVYHDEKELLQAFLDVVEDADILTGWNSEGFDIPYTVNRIKRLMGEEKIKELCLFGMAPREREYEKFKKKHKTYDLVGRVHLDYLLLYQKHNTQQLHSYKLDYVGELEVGENKVPYEGTLDKLWRDDFDKFIEYNRQDTLLLFKIDQKRKFIELANQIAHANCVLLKTTTGSVALVEQAIINDMHGQGFIVPDRKRTVYDREHGPGAYDRMREESARARLKSTTALVSVDDDPDFDGAPGDEGEVDLSRTPVVGAYVAQPKVGLVSEVACVDINSLYPSTLRALNMSPETIRGQCRSDETMALIEARCAVLPRNKRAEAWDGLFHSLEYGHILGKDDAPVTIDWEDGRSETRTGAQWYEFIFDPKNNLCITANGTLFDTAKAGMIPALLARWYAERKTLQAAAKWFGAVGKGLPLKAGDLWNGTTPDGLKLAADFTTRLRIKLDMAPPSPKGQPVGNAKNLAAAVQGDDVEAAARLMAEWNLRLDGDKIVAADKAEALFLSGLNDQRQLAKKILLNSLYGALLNEGLRFYDERVGQSVTLTGRSIVRHMNAKTNENITGVYDYKGEAIVYADTDSCYFSAYAFLKDREDFADFEWTRENIIELYDGISDVTNESFPEFMAGAFNCSLERGAIIAAGRELVAGRALFIKKKKYAALMYDKENERLDVNGKPGKLKAMGLDLKRADTPKIMQQHLEHVLMSLLTDKPRQEIFDDIRDFRREFAKLDPWKQGAPKAVKALSIYAEEAAKVDRAAKDLTGKALARSKKDKVKVNMPEQVSASLNWNRMLDLHNDRYSARITDGAKIIVCKLKGNVFGMNSIAYPIDEPHLPDWFKALPFDTALMSEKIIDNKLTNLVGVLDWDLNLTKDLAAEDLFTWG
jgi:DNA polymerase elongation subunit (family B)